MMKYLRIVPFQSDGNGGWRFSPAEVGPSPDLFWSSAGGEGLLALVICLDGALRGGCPVCGHSFRVVAGQSLLVSLPADWLHLESEANALLRGLLVFFHRKSLLSCYVAGGHEAAVARAKLFLDPERSHRIQSVPFTGLMKMIALQVLECSLASPVREIFLQSKALELLACCLGALERGGMTVGGSCCRLGGVAREKILQARKILVRDLENPPNLEELASRVGLSASKLKRGFRQMFGTSVFDYFRNHRLEAARRILEKGEMNVTGAAMAVGYSNIGHFCVAFRKQFGFNPGHCLRRGDTTDDSAESFPGPVRSNEYPGAEPVTAPP